MICLYTGYRFWNKQTDNYLKSDKFYRDNNRQADSMDIKCTPNQTVSDVSTKENNTLTESALFHHNFAQVTRTKTPQKKFRSVNPDSEA